MSDKELNKAVQDAASEIIDRAKTDLDAGKGADFSDWLATRLSQTMQIGRP